MEVNMKDIIGLAICLSAVLICSLVSFLAYHLGSESQKHIDKYNNDMDIEKYYIKGYKSGYKQGSIDVIKKIANERVNSRKK